MTGFLLNPDLSCQIGVFYLGAFENWILLRWTQFGNPHLRKVNCGFQISSASNNPILKGAFVSKWRSFLIVFRS
jgi:hypothetical protein